MAIKAEATSSNTKKFPKLMTNGMYVILFTTEHVGTVIQVHAPHSDNIWSIGEHLMAVPMLNYVDYIGTIKLTNK